MLGNAETCVLKRVLSAYPKSCFKGLITGELLRYWHQNTDERDFINITSLFIKRLTQRWHHIQDIIPNLQRAVASIDNSTRITANANNKQSEKNHINTLYITWKYHPSDITKQKIRNIYNKTLKNHDNFEKKIIAIKQAKTWETSYVTLNCNQLQTIMSPTS